MIKENKVKKILEDGGTVVGSFVKANDPAVVEILGRAGFDFFVADNEHVAMNKNDMLNLIRSGELADIAPIIRVRENRDVEILQALDSGAFGIQVPNIDTQEDAVKLAENSKYSPDGKRGFSPSVRAAAFGMMDKQDYVKKANENTLVVGHCESVTSMNNLDQILKEDIDVMFIGPMDLSQSLGIIGQGDHPKLKESIDKIIDKVTAAGKVVGMVASDAEGAQKLIDKGVRYVMISSDLGMLASTATKNLKQLKNQ